MTPPFNQIRVRFAASFVVTALSLSGCGRRHQSTAWWGGEREKIELANQLELQRFRFEQIYSGNVAQLDGCHTASKVANARAVALRCEREELERVVESLKGHLAEFKKSMLRSRRQQAMGKKFVTLRLASGRAFKNVSISAIEDSGVTIRHSDGSARLRFQDLDAGEQLFFGLEANLALIAQEKESREATAYEHWIARQIEIARQNDTAVATVSRSNKTAPPTGGSESPTLCVLASNVRPLAQPAQSVRSSGYRNYRYSAYRNCRPTYQTVYYDIPNCLSYPGNGIIAYPSQHCPVDYFRDPAVNPYKSSLADTTFPSNP